MYEVIYNKTYISLSLCLIAWLAFRFRPQIESFFDRIGKTVSFSLLAIVFRILPFLVVYLYFSFDAQSDVQIFWHSAQKAKELGIVYRDFLHCTRHCLLILQLFHWYFGIQQKL
jgi:hypothetical protein